MATRIKLSASLICANLPAPMKTLFEQSLFVLLESVVLCIMHRTGQGAGDMAKRHANLE